MTKTGHYLTGIGGSLLAFSSSAYFGGYEAVSAVFVFLGVTAPDWMEVRLLTTDDGNRVSIIPHRRVTHWMLGWVLLLSLAINLLPSFEGSCLLGFSIGGLLHVLTDFPNPMGVPVLHPWSRSSLRWWASGKREWLIVLGCAILGGTSLWLLKG